MLIFGANHVMIVKYTDFKLKIGGFRMKEMRYTKKEQTQCLQMIGEVFGFKEWVTKREV